MNSFPEPCLEERQRINEGVDPGVVGGQLFFLFGKVVGDQAVPVVIHDFPVGPGPATLQNLALDVELLVVRLGDGRVLQRREVVLFDLLVIENAGDRDPAEALGDFLVPGSLRGLGLFALLRVVGGGDLADNSAVDLFLLLRGGLLGGRAVGGGCIHAKHPGHPAHHAPRHPGHAASALLLLATGRGVLVGGFFRFLGDSLVLLVEGEDQCAATSRPGIQLRRREQFGSVADQAGARLGGRPGTGGREGQRVKRLLRLGVNQLLEAGVLDPLALDQVENVVGFLAGGQSALRLLGGGGDLVGGQADRLLGRRSEEKEETKHAGQRDHGLLSVAQTQGFDLLDLRVGHVEGSSHGRGSVRGRADPIELAMAHDGLRGGAISRGSRGCR